LRDEQDERSAMQMNNEDGVKPTNDPNVDPLEVLKAR
jgi:hypothetical protein